MKTDTFYDQSVVEVKVITDGEPDEACLAFSGDWGKFTRDGDQADQLIDRIMEKGYSRLLLELDDLERINSKFVSMLVLLLESDTEVSLMAPPDFLTDLLEMVGLTEKFQRYSDYESFFQSNSTNKNDQSSGTPQ